MGGLRQVQAGAGHHRPGNDAAAMAEIAENLHRREITALERAELIARWVALQEAKAAVKPAQVAQVSSKGGRGKHGGVSAAARDLGMTRDAVSRAVTVAKLSTEAKDAAKSSGLDDNQSALLAAAKAQDPDEQVAAIMRAAEVKAVRVQVPKRTQDDELVDRLAERWPVITKELRERVRPGALSAPADPFKVPRHPWGGRAARLSPSRRAPCE